MQELSFKLHKFIYQLGEDEWINKSFEKFGTPIKKEYLNLLLSSYKITNLKNYEDENEENVIKLLEVSAYINLFINEIERLEIKDKTNLYLKLISEKTRQ